MNRIARTELGVGVKAIHYYGDDILLQGKIVEHNIQSAVTQFGCLSKRPELVINKTETKLMCRA